MSGSRSKDNSVTWNQVAAFRLARHHLVDKATSRKLLSVLDDMTGAQAQLVPAAQLSLWSRIRGLQPRHIEDAFNKRTLVKASGMRRTLFLLPSKQLAVYVRGSARRAQKEYNWARRQGVPERVLDAAIEATLSVLDQPLTRPEIAERTNRVLGVQTRFVKGGGWGSRRELAAVPVGDLNYPVVYLLHLAASRGVVCYGPSQGNEPTFVRADAWIPTWQDVPQEQAERLLLRRYLKAFGPATTADFAMWTGVSQKEAQEIWARDALDLATVDVNGWTGTVLQEDVKPLMKAEFEQPSVRLLPYFDTFLLGHRERGHLVAKDHHGKIYRPQGWITPVVLVNGRVVATWGHTVKKNHLYAKVGKLEPLSKKTVTGIQEEVQNLARFLDVSDFDLKIN